MTIRSLLAEMGAEVTTEQGSYVADQGLAPQQLADIKVIISKYRNRLGLKVEPQDITTTQQAGVYQINPEDKNTIPFKVSVADGKVTEVGESPTPTKQAPRAPIAQRGGRLGQDIRMGAVKTIVK